MIDYYNYSFLSSYYDKKRYVEEDDLKSARNLLFIRYYVVKDGYIYIYSIHRTTKVPYRRELELEILEKMKEQILELDENKDEYPLVIDKKQKNQFYSSAFWFLLNISNTMIGEGVFRIAHGTFSVMFLLIMSYYGRDVVKNKIKLNDLRKHILFLANEDYINKTIYEKMISLGIVNSDAINLAPKFSSYATINDIHFMSSREVKRLCDGKIDEDTIYKLRKN